jgi:hypothetical protein
VVGYRYDRLKQQRCLVAVRKIGGHGRRTFSRVTRYNVGTKGCDDGCAVKTTQIYPFILS